ncbi:hypothetical protein [Chryseobacterium sp.]|uniref:hypothetical protein n=1 Tax=Chryseobacterium sp. TaxID=1871047 RepID=UPI0032197EB4
MAKKNKLLKLRIAVKLENTLLRKKYNKIKLWSGEGRNLKFIRQIFTIFNLNRSYLRNFYKKILTQCEKIQLRGGQQFELYQEKSRITATYHHPIEDFFKKSSKDMSLYD